MSTVTSTPAPDAPVATAESPLDWTVNPWRERARAATAAAFSAIVMAALVATARLPVVVALALAAAAVTLLAPGFAIIRCRVDDRGVARRLGGLWWERRPWDRIRLAQWACSGVLVSPERRPGTWAALRGLFLPLPASRGSRELRDELRRRMDRHGL